MERNSFKKAIFGGFRKKDVIRFFEEYNEEVVTEKQDLEMENGELLKKNDELTAQLEKLEQDNEVLTQQLVELLASAQAASKASAQYASQQEKIHQLEQALEQAQAQTCKEDVSTILMEAKKTSDMIVAQAKARAATMHRRSLLAVKQTADELGDVNVQIESLRDVIDDMVSSAQIQLDDISDKISDTRKYVLDYGKRAIVQNQKLTGRNQNQGEKNH